ncbi:MAG TPA: nicotinate-nucleotide adenylyltransferase, partial [Vicinamibacterales bacterium]
MSDRRIGILGGTFDPIHVGHLDVGRAAEEALNLSRVYVVTAKTPAHRAGPVASPFQRFAMVALAIPKHVNWRASDMELRHEAVSYTVDTLERFAERGYDRSELFFILGADAFASIDQWRDYPRVLDLANFAVVSRPRARVDALKERLPQLLTRMAQPADQVPAGETRIFLIDAQTADVSSSAIRAKCETGQTIEGLVTPIVQQYIEQHGLYAPRSSGRRASDA